MTTLPSNNNNEEQPFIGKEYRDKVIAGFPLEKQFLIRTQLKDTESLNKEQAIELLKEYIVQSAQKDLLFLNMMKKEF